MLLAGKPGMRLLRHYCVLLLPLVCVSVCDLLVSCMAWQGFALQACMHTGWRAVRPVRLAYQPPASSTFLSKQTSQQQPANSTFLSEQTSTSHQPPAIRTVCMARSLQLKLIFVRKEWVLYTGSS
jgi:hypothetical protein